MMKYNLNWRVFMQVVLSLGLVASSLFVVLAQHGDASARHWAFGMIGMVMGFWLRAESHDSEGSQQPAQ
jgi:hypothetical protein